MLSLKSSVEAEFQLYYFTTAINHLKHVVSTNR